MLYVSSRNVQPPSTQLAGMATPSLKTRVAIVQHTHTLASAAFLQRARGSVLEWRHEAVSMHHHVVLWGDNAAHCHNLTAAVPFADNVSCVPSRGIPSVLPALEWRGAAIRDRTPLRTKGNAMGAHQQWAWKTCDGSWLWWFVAGRVERYDFYWMLEWDVVWTGDLASLLAAFHGVAYDVPAACDSFPQPGCNDGYCKQARALCACAALRRARAVLAYMRPST